MKTTITDVAARAGVSMKTVSRVLNGEPNVSQKTREKVQEAAKDLNYSPNLAARGLASSKTYLIALLYDIPSPGYVITLQKGASAACREHGYHLVVEPMDASDKKVARDVEATLRRLPVDGVILAPPLCDKGEIVSILHRLNIPYIPVSPSTSHGDISVVGMDNVKAAKEITQHLIDLGHRDIGFIKGHPRHSDSAQRFQGFRDAMRASGTRINPKWIEDGLFTYESGVAAAQILLSGPERPTAIFACNDEMAAGVMSVANKKGFDLPGELSICGFDDVPLADIISPRLTTVQQPVQDMGYRAAKLLLPNAAKEEILRKYQLDYQIIIRESTASKT